MTSRATGSRPRRSQTSLAKKRTLRRVEEPAVSGAVSREKRTRGPLKTKEKNAAGIGCKKK